MATTNHSPAENTVSFIPWRIACLYAVIGGLWILFSDRLLLWIVGSTEMYETLQTYKGWAFVLTTAALLYVSLRTQLRWLTHENQLRRASEAQYRELNHLLEERVIERTTEISDLYNHAPCGYLTVDQTGNITNVNDTALKWLGYAREDMLGQDIAHFLQPNCASATGTILQQAFWLYRSNGLISNAAAQMLRCDGSRFPVLLNASGVYNAAHELVLDRITVIDMTELQQTEKALRDSDARLSFLLTETPAIIFTLALEQGIRMTYCSESVKKVLGFEAKQFIEHPTLYEEHILPEDLAHFQSNWSEILQRGETLGEYRFRCADGHYRWLSSGMRVVRDAQNQPQEIIGYAVDVTTQKQAEDDLRASELHLRRSRDALQLANAELAKASRLKDEFLASMSHELRTPLTAILGLSQGLLEDLYGPLTLKQRDSVQTLQSSGTHLLNLINDILDLSKIEAGALELEKSVIAIQPLCAKSIELVKGMAGKKHLRTFLTIDSAVESIVADERRLQQMLVNLLSNAVKFTDEGKKIGLEIIGDADTGTARFTVWDTGIGIAQEDMGRLFQRFMQIDSTLSRRYPGTGLGLSLVARMAEIHGGSVEVSSEVGKGSRFTIILPWVPNSAAPAGNPSTPIEEPPPTITRGAKILLVEDNEVNIITIRSYLEAKGYHLAIARNGLEALNLVNQNQPQLILMDIQMPIMDGLEAMRRLRAMDNAEVAHVPIIALSALAMQGDRDRLLAAGANEYLSKPVNLKHLVNRIESLLAQPTASIPTLPTLPTLTTLASE